MALLLRDCPDLNIEIDSNYGLVDIVENRFDAGVPWASRFRKR